MRTEQYIRYGAERRRGTGAISICRELTPNTVFAVPTDGGDVEPTIRLGVPVVSCSQTTNSMTVDLYFIGVRFSGMWGDLVLSYGKCCGCGS